MQTRWENLGGSLPNMVDYVWGGMPDGYQPEIINKLHCPVSPSQHWPIYGIGRPTYEGKLAVTWRKAVIYFEGTRQDGDNKICKNFI